MSVPVILSEYIREELLSGADTPLDESENLLAEGILDSLGIIRLVSFVEEKFNVIVPDEDVTLENFQSIKKISEYINSL